MMYEVSLIIVVSTSLIFAQLAALRPPFLGDSFPTLKRAVVAGRYPSIPRKYSDALSRVIGMMLRVNPRDRPTAEDLLNSADLAGKLQLDEVVTSFAAQEVEKPMNLMETIKVPSNLRHLNGALPKACYPDVRPHSPTAWIVADQDKMPRPPLPPSIPPLPQSDLENLPPAINRQPFQSEPQEKPVAPSNQKDIYSRYGPGGIAAYRNLPVPAAPVPPPVPVYSRPRHHAVAAAVAPAAPMGVKPPVNPRAYQHQNRIW